MQFDILLATSDKGSIINDEDDIQSLLIKIELGFDLMERYEKLIKYYGKLAGFADIPKVRITFVAGMPSVDTLRLACKQEAMWSKWEDVCLTRMMYIHSITGSL